MANIRINALPNDPAPSASDVLPIDGANTRKTSIENILDTHRKITSQAMAEAGINNTEIMTPLRTAQAITAQGANQFATTAQGANADTALQPADIGVSVQAYDNLLNSVSGLTIASQDLIVGSGTNTVSKLGKGTDGQYLAMVSGNVEWADVAANTIADDAVGSSALQVGSVTSSKKSAATIAKDEGFATVALLLADTVLTYTLNQSGTVTTGDIVIAQGLRFEVVASGVSDHHIESAGGVKFNAIRSGTGYDLRQFGVISDSSSDATTNRSNIQAAIDQANSDGVRTVLTCPGVIYVDDEIFIKTNVVGAFLTFKFIPSNPNKACCNVGTKQGSYLVRVGGWIGCVVDATGTTQVGTVGFSVGHGARACFINQNCRAVMNNNGGAGSATIDYGHIGFQMLGVKPDLVENLQGAYQNDIQGSVFNAKRAFYADTEGYGLAGWAPEMNGNTAKITAYSCRTNGAYLGEGAQENLIHLRADTFVNQNGQGTTINVVEVRGSYNRIEVDEEIGAVADTQHTVAFEGDNARYNEVGYQTQNVVTSAGVDNTTGSATGKNVTRLLGRPNHMSGGDVFCASGYVAAAAGSALTYDSVVICRRAKLVKVVAENVAAPTTYTRLYFAKNGAIDTVQRLAWSNTDAAGTRKEKNVDPTASGTIDSRFIYQDGDVVDIRVDQDGSGGNTVRYTLYFTFLE